MYAVLVAIGISVGINAVVDVMWGGWAGLGVRPEMRADHAEISTQRPLSKAIISSTR
jgi:hypothetical protein